MRANARYLTRSSESAVLRSQCSIAWTFLSLWDWLRGWKCIPRSTSTHVLSKQWL